MKLTLLVIAGLFSYGAMTQITIDQGDFADGGDTALVSVSADFDLDFTSTGPDYNWDYSALNMASQRIDTFFDIGDANFTYQLIFNNGFFDPDYQANYFTHLLNFALPPTDFIGITIENPVGFTKIESDRVEIVGIGLEISGFALPVKNEIIDVEYELPFSYADNWLSNSRFELDLNPAFDGILRRYQERTSQVDGWGTIKTPFGVFEAVRTVSYLDFTDSIRFSFGGGDPTWVALPTPDQIVYSWWTKDQKIPVLQVVVQNFLGAETITSVEYKDRYLGDVSIIENQSQTFKMFPNPSSDWVQIITKEAITKVELFTVDGKQCDTFQWNQFNNSLNIAHLSAGIYFVTVSTGNSILTQQLIVE